MTEYLKGLLMHFFVIKKGDLDKMKKENAMSEEARQARNAYKRKWAKDNPDKIRAATRRYWERKAQAITQEG